MQPKTSWVFFYVVMPISMRCDSQIEDIIATVRDSNLKLTLAFGIGMHHAGLHERDRKTVEELFVNCKIQVKPPKNLPALTDL